MFSVKVERSKMSIKSDEVNFLVYRYLLESGKAAEIPQSRLSVCVCVRFPAFCFHVWC